MIIQIYLYKLLAGSKDSFAQIIFVVSEKYKTNKQEHQSARTNL